MQTLKIVEEIKKLAVEERGALIREKSALQKRYSDGIGFFLADKQRTRSEIAKADETMKDICKKLDSITQRIFEIDIMIGVKLETLFSDKTLQISLNSRTNESGDKLPAQKFKLSDMESDKLSITTDDLYALKILKPALNYQNIEIIERTEE